MLALGRFKKLQILKPETHDNRLRHLNALKVEASIPQCKHSPDGGSTHALLGKMEHTVQTVLTYKTTF